MLTEIKLFKKREHKAEIRKHARRVIHTHTRPIAKVSTPEIVEMFRETPKKATIADKAKGFFRRMFNRRTM